MKFKLKFSLLFWLIILSFFTRIAIAYKFGDQSLNDNEWGVLLNNLINYRNLSFYKFGDQFIPSVFMPPMYTFFLYFIKVITFAKINFINSVIFVQIILSTFSVYVFYTLSQKFFSNKLSLFNSSIFSFFPLNLYVVGQISSISLQILLSLLFLKYFFSFLDEQSKKNLIILSIISSILILTRGEFILVFIITLIYLSFRKRIRLEILLKVILIVLLIISPYLIRNYIIFNEIIIVKSSGYNLWKGNNQSSLIEGSRFLHPPNPYDDDPWKQLAKPEFKILKSKLENIKIDKYYEINRDKIFLDEAKNNLLNDPARYISLFFKKIFSYYFVDLESSYPNYYNFFHFFPVLILSIFSLPGFIELLKKNNFKTNYLLIYMSINLIIFSIFFILPRYKLIILPIQIILVGYLIQYILNKFSKSENL